MPEPTKPEPRHKNNRAVQARPHNPLKILQTKPLQLIGQGENAAEQSGKGQRKMLIRSNILQCGEFYKAQASEITAEIRQRTWRIIGEHFGDESSAETQARLAHTRMEPGEFLDRLRQAKYDVFEDETLRKLTRTLCLEYAFEAGSCLYEPLRLRAIPPTAATEDNPSFWAHRDTWFANPQSQINHWIALHDVGPADSFTFYPTCFENPVPNNSGDFDYDQWSKAVGFGNSQMKARGGEALYPRNIDDTVYDATHEAARGFALKGGEMLLFSAAHLHSTNKHQGEYTRFSLDFRVLDKRDESLGLSAPDVDNDSRGSVISEYLPI